MLGKMYPYSSVPFHWTNNYGKNLMYAGFAQAWDTVHIDGEPKKNDFIAYYIKDN